MKREELERYTERWLRDTDTISDNEYSKVANDYLQAHSYKLHKYQKPFADGEPLDWFVESLTNHTLGLSKPSTFNDPFDCQFAIPNDFTDVLRAQKAIKSTNDAFFRVGCLTETYDNRLMWSHYGGSYRGVCVEYDVSNFSAVQTACYFAPVIYGKKRPKILKRIVSCQDTMSPLTSDEKLAMTRALYTKDEVWKYERGWRIIKVNRFSESPKPFPLTMPSITAIYLGPACVSDLTKLQEICKEENIKLQMLTLHQADYQLELGQQLV